MVEIDEIGLSRPRAFSSMKTHIISGWWGLGQTNWVCHYAALEVRSPLLYARWTALNLEDLFFIYLLPFFFFLVRPICCWQYSLRCHQTTWKIEGENLLYWTG